ncbi:hypothetical protein EKD04_017395 [Chloroflexales bacterium ZM16-3]|nr:hypothetical protein [Chloroflexales bacterium ZM16-3]
MRQKTRRIILAALLGVTLALGVAWTTGAAAPQQVACGPGSCNGTGGGG